MLLGPFPDYRSSMGILMGSAAELWEFADPQSEVSKRLEASMKAILSYGARLTYIGSIDDQLVPVEVCCPLSQTRLSRFTHHQPSLPYTRRPTTRTSTAPFSSTAGSTPPTC